MASILHPKAADFNPLLCCLQWQEKGDVDVDIGANPSAEGGDEDAGGGSTSQKVVDLIDAFRLNVSIYNVKIVTE